MNEIGEEFLVRVGMSDTPAELHEFLIACAQERYNDISSVKFLEALGEEKAKQFASIADFSLAQLKEYLSDIDYAQHPVYTEALKRYGRAGYAGDDLQREALSDVAVMVWLQGNLPNYFDLTRQALQQTIDDFNEKRDVLIQRAQQEVAAQQA